MIKYGSRVGDIMNGVNATWTTLNFTILIRLVKNECRCDSDFGVAISLHELARGNSTEFNCFGCSAHITFQPGNVDDLRYRYSLAIKVASKIKP